MDFASQGPFRLIVDAGADGPSNMARDEALSLCSSRPVIRFYMFRPPTVSIGRFQAAATVDRERVLRDGLGFVRRPTGGQAVLHDDELTYSVILPRSNVREFPKRAVYRFVSTILADGLRRFGIPADFALERQGSPLNPNCFATRGEYELATPQGRKIVGSAQATHRHACLQHGSIPLGGSFRRITSYLADGTQPGLAGGAAATSTPTSIGEEIGRTVDFAEAVAVFAAAFARCVDIVASVPSPEEERVAARLVREKYGSDEWNLLY